MFPENPGRLPVEVVAVLDAVDSCLGAHLHAPGGVVVGEHRFASGLRLVDDGCQLLGRVLDRVGLVGGAGAAPSGHDLDVVSPQAELFPGGLPHLVHAVGDDAKHSHDDGRSYLGGKARIRMAARHGDGPPAYLHFRCGDEPLLLGLPEAGVDAPGVTDGGESLHERILENLRGPEARRRGKDFPVKLPQVVGEERSVHVAVDQPRHQGLSPAVRRFRSGDVRGGAASHFPNDAVLRDDPRRKNGVASSAVKKRRVGKKNDTHAFSPFMASFRFS